MRVRFDSKICSSVFYFVMKFQAEFDGEFIELVKLSWWM